MQARIAARWLVAPRPGGAAGNDDEAPLVESRYNVWHASAEARYVYNGVSGALLRLPHDAADEARNRALLAEGGMLVPAGTDELEILTERYRLTQTDRTHLHLTLVTSLGCNFDCPYCFERKSPAILNHDVEEAILVLLDDQLPCIQRFSVTWFGGEPLLGKRALMALSDAFVARCADHHVDYDADLVTNGQLLDASTCGELRERGVRHVQVTLAGAPEWHDRLRPHADGGGTFWRIVDRLPGAARHFDVTIRVDLSADNDASIGELFAILVERGLAGHVTVEPGHVVASDAGAGEPSASFGGACFRTSEFAARELRFLALAREYGLQSETTLPGPIGAPCTAVRANEWVVGARGELMKCWGSVGNPDQVIGNIRDYARPNSRIRRWLDYDPFANDECRSCVALPVCMGGCANRAAQPALHADRCSTFRFNHVERVRTFVEEHDAPAVRR